MRVLEKEPLCEKLVETRRAAKIVIAIVLIFLKDLVLLIFFVYSTEFPNMEGNCIYELKHV